MNIYDIAEKSGVSIATVSRAINGGLVKEKTKEKIMKIVEEEGYIPNAYAKNLTANETKIVGVFLPEVEDIYCSRATATLEKELREHGYDMLLYSIGDRFDDIEKNVSMMLSRRIDALFVVGSKFQRSSAYATLKKAARKIPVIGINSEFDGEGMYSVMTDDRRMVSSLVADLYAKGHRSFLYLYNTISPNGLKKLDGFKKGIEELKLDINKQELLLTEEDYALAKDKVLQILRSRKDITAVICAQDELAVGAVKASLALKLKIPDDIVITGYDNSLISYCSTPEITSVDNLPDKLAILATETFFKVLAGESVEKKKVIDCKLVVRETT